VTSEDSIGNMLISGKCVLVPEYCSLQLDPVCGCDGETYSNACFADQVGMGIAYLGQCSAAKQCTANGDCASEEFCRTDIGDCSSNTNAGLCTEKPLSCYQIFAPVCGCNNATYGNDCKAFGRGVNIAYKGTCTGTAK